MMREIFMLISISLCVAISPAYGLSADDQKCLLAAINDNPAPNGIVPTANTIRHVNKEDAVSAEVYKYLTDGKPSYLAEVYNVDTPYVRQQIQSGYRDWKAMYALIAPLISQVISKVMSVSVVYNLAGSDVRVDTLCLIEQSGFIIVEPDNKLAKFTNR